MLLRIDERRNEEISIHFPPSASLLESSSLKLLEVSTDLLNEITQGGQFVIKGSETEEAVLCTAGRTYSMKKAETSNSVYLLSASSSQSYTIESRCREYFEVKGKAMTIKSCGDMLRSLILISSADGSRNSAPLATIVEAMLLSESEIRRLAPSIGAAISFSSDGAEIIQLFDKTDIFAMIDLLLSEIITRKWSLESIPLQSCYQALTAAGTSFALSSSSLINLGEDGTKRLVDFVLQTVRDSTEAVDKIVKLDRVKLSRIRALLILQQHKLVLKEKFLLEWSLATPGIDPSNPDESLLEGIVQEKKVGKPLSSYYEISTQLHQRLHQQSIQPFEDSLFYYLFIE